MFKGQTITAHTGSTKTGSYKLVTGKIVDFESRNITSTHYVLEIVIEADGKQYRTTKSRVIEVVDVVTDEPVIIAEVEDIERVTPDVIPSHTVTPEPVYTVDMPGAFADYFAGSGVAEGDDDKDPLSKATRLAFEGGKRRNRGRGYSLTVTAPWAVLDVFTQYAETVLQCGGEWTSGERSGATKWIERVNAL